MPSLLIVFMEKALAFLYWFVKSIRDLLTAIGSYEVIVVTAILQAYESFMDKLVSRLVKSRRTPRCIILWEWVRLRHYAANLQRIKDNEPTYNYVHLGFFFLNYHHLLNQGLFDLIEALQLNTQVHSIIFLGNGIQCEQVPMITKIINNETSAIRLLNLNNNNIGIPGIRLLCEALANNKKIKTLRLDNNKLNDDGAITLAVGLSNNDALEDISLSANVIGPRGATALAEGLSSNKNLKRFCVKFNLVRAAGVKALAKNLVCGSQSLQMLNLNHCLVGDEGATFLAEALRNNNTLTELNLSQNRIEDKGAIQLAECLENHLEMRSLNLFGNKIEKENVSQSFTKIHFYSVPVQTTVHRGPNGRKLHNCKYTSKFFSWKKDARIKLKNGQYPLQTAAQRNVKWEDGLRVLYENNSSVIEMKDSKTGMYPFMLAAEGYGSNVNSVYQLLRLHPGLLHESIQHS